MKHKIKFIKKSFSPVRRIMSDFNWVAGRNPSMIGVIEPDVTKIRTIFKEFEEKTDTKISFTAWVVKCVSQVVCEHKDLQTFRKGRKWTIIPESVDVGIMVERTAKDIKVPVSYVIRNADKKNLLEIHHEIREVQSKPVEEKDQFIGKASKFVGFYLIVPRFIRRYIIRKIISNGKYISSNAGTVGVTAVGMHGKMGGWVFPFRVRTLDIGVGGISQRPYLEKGRIAIHEHLNMTILIDHDIIDGGPATRFVGRLVELMENAFSTDDIHSDQRAIK